MISHFPLHSKKSSQTSFQLLNYVWRVRVSERACETLFTAHRLLDFAHTLTPFFLSISEPLCYFSRRHFFCSTSHVKISENCASHELIFSEFRFFCYNFFTSTISFWLNFSRMEEDVPFIGSNRGNLWIKNLEKNYFTHIHFTTVSSLFSSECSPKSNEIFYKAIIVSLEPTLRQYYLFFHSSALHSIPSHSLWSLFHSPLFSVRNVFRILK